MNGPTPPRPTGSRRPRSAPLPPDAPLEAWADLAETASAPTMLPPFSPDWPSDAHDDHADEIRHFVAGLTDQPAGDDHHPSAPAAVERAAELADRLDRFAAILRRDGIAGVTATGLRHGDRFEAMLAGLIAGYFTALD